MDSSTFGLRFLAAAYAVSGVSSGGRASRRAFFVPLT